MASEEGTETSRSTKENRREKEVRRGGRSREEVVKQTRKEESKIRNGSSKREEQRGRKRR